MMEYQISARKFRPANFEDVIGQPHVVQTLTNAIGSKRIAQAFLFSGTRGVGKTTMARILAKALNCEQGPTGTPCGTCPNCSEIAQGTSVDVIEIDGASNTSVDDVRELRENVKFAPFRGTYRIYIIDEVHMLSNSAFNALLKTLEEPPPHVIFVFATTEIHKIPATILSRCQHYNFRRIPKAEVIHRLRHVAEHGGIAVEDRSLASIARAAQGSMRDALSLLDQAIAYGGTTIRHSDLELLLGAIPQEHVRAMVLAVLSQNSAASVRTIAQLLDQGHDLRAYCAELVEYLRHLLVAAVVPAAEQLRGLIDLSDDELRQIREDARTMTPEQLQDLFRIFCQAEDELRLSGHPRFVLEVAAVRATRLLSMAASSVSAAPAARPDVKAKAAPGSQPLQPPPNDPRQRPPSQTASVPASQTVPRPPTPPPSPSHGSQTAASSTGTASALTAPSATAPRVTPAATHGSQPAALSTGAASAPTAPRPTSTPGPATHSASPPRPQPAAPQPPSKRGARPMEQFVQSDSVPTEPPMSLNWEQVLDRVESQQPNLAPFLSVGKPVLMERGEIKLAYPATASVARAMVEKPEHLRFINAVCGELAGQPVRLVLVELTDELKAGPSMAEMRAARERGQKEALLEQTRSHPLVKQTLEIFGAQLAAVRERSPDKETSS